jgi:hypothetical protein
VLFGEEDIYLLGATTLEILKLMVDPVNQELVPAPPMRGRPFSEGKARTFVIPGLDNQPSRTA